MTKHTEGTGQSDARSMLELGISFKESGQMGNAATWFERAYEACLAEWERHLNAMSLARLGGLSPVIFEEQSKDLCDVLLSLGNHLSELGDHDRAVTCWNNVLRLEHTVPGEMTPHFARMKLIQHYIDTGDMSSAEEQQLVAGFSTVFLGDGHDTVRQKARELYAQVPALLYQEYRRQHPETEAIREWAAGVLSEDFEVPGELSQLELDILRVGELGLSAAKRFPDLEQGRWNLDALVDAVSASGKVNLPSCLHEYTAHEPLRKYPMLSVAAAKLAANGYANQAMEAFRLLGQTYEFMHPTLKNLYDGYTQLLPAIVFWLRPDRDPQHEPTEVESILADFLELGMTPEEARDSLITN